jgi:hypothetical protein
LVRELRATASTGAAASANGTTTPNAAAVLLVVHPARDAWQQLGRYGERHEALQRRAHDAHLHL